MIEKQLNKLGLSRFNTYYWEYQYKLGKEYIVPHLQRLGFSPKAKSVCEIGSAEGGVLFAVKEAGASNCLATDIAQSRLDAGEIIARNFGYSINFVNHNIISDQIPSNWLNSFDLVILRDVIEHLDDARMALNNIKKILKPDGWLYITFPPYYSPFGGHQHLLQTFFGKIPFIHWLPDSILNVLIKNGRPVDLHEVKRLRGIRLTVKKFFQLAHNTGFAVLHSEFFIIRPVYKFKFGLKTIRLPKPFASTSLKEIFATEASFILVKEGS